MFYVPAAPGFLFLEAILRGKYVCSVCQKEAEVAVAKSVIPLLWPPRGSGLHPETPRACLRPLCFAPLSRLGSVLRRRSKGEGKEIRNCSHVTSLLFSPEPAELQALPSDSSNFLLSRQPWRFPCFPRPQTFRERAPSCAVPASVLACTEG